MFVIGNELGSNNEHDIDCENNYDYGVGSRFAAY
jgi:hypothetical protein